MNLDDENSENSSSFIEIFEKPSNNENKNFLLDSFDSNIKEPKIINENETTKFSTLLIEENNEKENIKNIFDHLIFINQLNYSFDDSSQKIEIINLKEQINNNINEENLNQNYEIVKKKPARKDYLIKKMLSIISKFLIKKLKEINNKFKKINLKTELNYEKLKICLNKKIEKLLKKNDTNDNLINLNENNKNLNEILNLKLIEFINNNYETLNNKYKEYFNNEFKLKFENAKLFQNINSIKNLINEIISTKGNKMK